jgi:hypothetical protein
MRASLRQFGSDNQTDVIWEDLVDAKTVELTANDNTVYNFIWLDSHGGFLSPCHLLEGSRYRSNVRGVRQNLLHKIDDQFKLGRNLYRKVAWRSASRCRQI